MLDYERNYPQYQLIAGVDEAGRGPLAGPVCVACALMPLDHPIEGINDSKKLSEKKREFLYEEIVQKALAYHVVMIHQDVIDQINILQATKRAMCECINNLPIKPDFVLIDAVKGLQVNVLTEAVIHGDALSYNIASASILAKVTRDRFMVDADRIYPDYGFAKHKGYGTAAHIDALKRLGPCALHRRSFIKNFVSVSHE